MPSTRPFIERLFAGIAAAWAGAPPLGPAAADAFAEALLCLAAADGRFRPVEAETFRRAFAAATGRELTPAAVVRRVEAFIAECRGAGLETTALAAAERLSRHQGTPEGRAMLLTLDAAAAADGTFPAAERVLLERFRAALAEP